MLYAEHVNSRDLENIQTITISLISDSDIAQVLITDNDGNVLEAFTADHNTQAALSRSIRINAATESGYNQIGTLKLVLSKKRLYENLYHRLISELVLLLILISTVALSIFIAFRQSINRPLEMLTHQAHHDDLTNLINRRGFEQMLERVVKNRRHPVDDHILMYLDLDNFKQLNDREGHQAGDDALRQIASLLKSCVREEDFVARIGGDEFTILLVNCNIQIAVAIGEKISKGIREAFFGSSPDGDDISVSIGIIPIDDIGEEIQGFMNRADEACYAAKHDGRNRIAVYTDNEDTSPDITEMPNLKIS